MGFNPFLCRPNDSSDQGQAKRQLADGDVYRALKVPRTERGISELGVPPTASEVESVLIPRKESAKRKGGMRRRVINDSALDAERKAYQLAQDVFEGAPSNGN